MIADSATFRDPGFQPHSFGRRPLLGNGRPLRLPISPLAIADKPAAIADKLSRARQVFATV